MGTKTLVKVVLTLALLYEVTNLLQSKRVSIREKSNVSLRGIKHDANVLERECNRELKDFHSRVYVFSNFHQMYYVCDTHTDQGGWIIIQRRVENNVPFRYGWEEYKKGFGHKCTDYWLGNEHIHQITSQSRWELRIDMVYDNKFYYALYTHFYLENEENKYRLRYKRFIGGNVNDMLASHNGQFFSTKDRDNDSSGNRHCAKHYDAGWWYAKCHQSNLNGVFTDNSLGYGVIWEHLTGDHDSLTSVEMKIREI